MRSRGPPDTERLAVKVLGYPELRWADTLLKPPTQKALAIVCYLAVREQPVSRDELTELLWAAGAGRNLRTELHRLRSLPNVASWLHIDGALALNATTDLNAFKQALYNEHFEEAITLHSGETLLRGLEPHDAPAFSEWLEVERASVNALLVDALRGRALELEREGKLLEALGLIRQLITLDALDESAYRTAMRIEYRRGHFQAALSYFETCRRVLAEELELEPLAETIALAREVEQGVLVPLPQVTSRPRLPLKLLRPPVLVGREREWARMEAAWEVRQSIYLFGPAGAGKTRLMMDFIRSKGSYLLNEGHPGDAALPLSSYVRSVQQALTMYPQIIDLVEPWVKHEAMRFLPNFLAERPVSIDMSSEDRRQTYKALSQFLYITSRLVATIAVDDLHLYDTASNEVGAQASFDLVSVAAEQKLARQICCARTHELPPKVENVMMQHVEAGLAIHIDLEPLDVTAVQGLLRSLDLSDTDGLAGRLYRLAGGNPLFLIEALKRLHETGNVPELPERIAPPARVSTIINRRLNSLSGAALTLAQALAASQQTVKMDVLAVVLNKMPLEITEGLAELENAQILKEGSFVHDLLYEAVLASTASAVSKFLHRRLAEVLGQTGGENSRIAYHWQQAGEIDKAIQHWLEAAHTYQAKGLHEGAADLLRQVIRHAPDSNTRQEAELELVEALLELGRDKEAREAVETLLHEALSPRQKARTYEVMALIELGRGQLQEALVKAKKGSELALALEDENLQQHLTLLQARIFHRAEQHQEALELLMPLLDDLRQGPPSIGLARVLSEVAALHDNLGRSEDALPLHYQALELTHQLGAPHHQVIATSHLVFCLIELGRPEDVLAPAEAMLSAGPYRFSDLLRSNLGRAYLSLNRIEEAKRHYLHLSQHSADPSFRAVAWARLADIHQHLHQYTEVQQALEQARASLQQSSYPRAHARVAIVTLRYGNKRQKEDIASYVKALDLERLPAYMRAELEPLLT